ncbi:WASH complex subunit 2 [Episyrphus balteatus]|uniref:WASH complex subunit 2 n=1 Tax=Episyrphus balteatus TaxID=286459 RepID=UPI0024866D5B|nr:WASH complex subunit 2 [Episyrphus balteatus]
MDNEVSLDKIVEKSKQWTLEGDCSLLQWMNQISNNLEERVTKTTSAINDMSIKLDRTSIALSNVTNNLAALQYSKFVENRVHDDDETLSVPVTVPNDDVTDNKNSGQDIYSFLKKNLEMMNSCHEAYSISYEDSDDDDDEPVTNVVYRSKNPYEARPLPHIYGSTLWKEKWHIGLCDSDNDFSGDENSEQFSESSSTADESYESTAPTMSEWDSTAWGLNTQNNIERKDMHTPSNDGESSYQGDDYSQSKVSTPRTQRSVAISQPPQPIQDQRYYHHIPRRQENLFDDIFNESKPQEVPTATQVVPPQNVPSQVVTPQVITAPQKKIIPESYIPNEPPPDEQSIESDNNRRVGAKKTLNLFDDDEFSSFMDQIVQKATNKNIKSDEQPQKNPEPPKKTVAPNLFNDFNDDTPADDDFQSKPKKAESSNIFNEPSVHKQQQPIKSVAQNLFNDSDDLFSRPSEKVKDPPKKTVAPNLFSDSDDLFTPSISKPPVVVKQKASSPKLEDDIFTPSPKSSAIIEKTKIKNLFDDDDEDDDFDNIFASKPSSSKTFTQATKNLFEDDLSVEPENKGVTLAKDESIEEVTKEGLFDDDKNSPVLQEETVPKVPLMKETPNVQKVIFDVEKEASPLLKEDTSKIGSLLKKGLFDDFDDLEDEDDIFSTKPAKKDPFENLFEKDKKLSVIPSKSLFGDDEEEDLVPKVTESRKEDQVEKNNLFGDEVPKVTESRKGDQVENNNLFGDEDEVPKVIESKIEKQVEKKTLYGNEEDEDKGPKLPESQKEDQVEKMTLFSDKKDEDESPKITPSKQETQVEKRTLFGDEENAEESSKVIESKKEQQIKKNENKKPSIEAVGKGSEDDIFVPSGSSKPKTQFDDIFADDVPEDNFDGFVLSKSEKVNEKVEDIPETKPSNLESTVTSTKPAESSNKPAVASRLPVIAQKPMVDKTSKPQIMPRKNTKSDLLEKSQEEASKQGIEKVSSSRTEESHPNKEPLETPQHTEFTKMKPDSVSKLSSKPEVLKFPEEEILDTPSSLKKQNTQTIAKSDDEDIKPIPKPKPKVIIEEVKISTPSKETSVVPVEQTEKKPSTIPSYTSLFHDDLPPEDENPNPTSNEESPMHTVDDDVEIKPVSSTSVPYSSLNLFADVPPDDYFLVSTPTAVTAAAEPQTKRIHSIFYDDFHETIEAGREMRGPSSYMINDEPPPDDSDNKPIVSEIKKEKPQVSKLKKMNFQINVGALLPSAKMPSFKKAETIEKNTPSEIVTNEDPTPIAKSPVNNEIIPSPESSSAGTRELPENILPNLNRDRAKVQVKRRPSTRTGRQERYRKSMIEDTVSSNYHDENETDNEIKQSMSSSVFEGFSSRTEDTIVSKQEVSEKQNQTKTVSSSLYEDFGTFNRKEQLTEEKTQSSNQLPDEATLFEEPDNIFNKKVASSSSSKATITKLPVLFKDSDSEPENIFETMKSNKSNTKESLPVTKNLDSLFDSDDGIDENPFGTPKNFFSQSQSIVKKETIKPTEDSSKPADSLFEPAHQKEIQPAQPAFKPTEAPVKTTPKSSTLFGDSDDGSDDLFKDAKSSKKTTVQKKPEQKPKTKPVSKPVKQKASLFSSDEDSGSGDNLFGGKARTKTASKKIEPANDKASSNLFADLSDDDSDGLFGTSTKKPIAVNKSKPTLSTNRARSTKQPAQAQPAKAISNNPLSDLLGP